ncbi:HupE/UreJ family protein [Rossellomorea vietnamensis]|uniref:HupE/UreJ family protein n=1 Tax=Rossellomorea vietnamensis TaxID=218284 RepID=UPI003CE8D7CB
MKKLIRCSNMLLILLSISLFMQPFQTNAHSGSIGYSEITINENTIEYELYLLADLVGGLLGIDENQDGYLTEDEVTKSEKSIQELVINNLQIKSGGKVPEVTVNKIEQAERWNYSMFHIDLDFNFAEPVTDYAIQYNIFFDGIDMNHQNFITVQQNGFTAEHVVTANNNLIEGNEGGALAESTAETAAAAPPAVNKDETEAEEIDSEKIATEEKEDEKEKAAASLTSGNQGSNGSDPTGFIDYLVLGMTHIWGGIDHLLFIVGLLLMRGTVKDYVKILTAFTVGHSLTLGLAAMKIFIIPGSIIEPLIALSIVYVAIENIWAKKRGDTSFKGRWILVLFFGLIHGFGFAGFLAGKLEGAFVLPLLSFNLGVEIGQIAVLAVLFPVIYYMRKLRYQTQIMYSASALVSLFGLYWLIERLI